MTRKAQEPRRHGGPGSLNLANQGAWETYVKDHLVGEGSKARMRELFSAFLDSPFYKTPYLKPPLSPRLRPWDNTEIIDKIETEMIQAVWAPVGQLQMHSPTLRFLLDDQIQRVVSACMLQLSETNLPRNAEHELRDFLRVVRTVVLARGELSWNTIKYGNYFKWPSTAAPHSQHISAVDGNDWDEGGPLGMLGYKVGISSPLSRATRESLLVRAFEMNIAARNQDLFVTWGRQASPFRLRKIAESIAAFVRNAKRNWRGDYRQAVTDWEKDLGFLHAHYYLPMLELYHIGLGFDWPQTDETELRRETNSR